MTPPKKSKKAASLELMETYISDDGQIAYFDCPIGFRKKSILHTLVKMKRRDRYKNLIAVKIAMLEYKNKQESVVFELEKEAESIFFSKAQIISYGMINGEYLIRRFHRHAGLDEATEELPQPRTEESEEEAPPTSLHEIWGQSEMPYLHDEPHSIRNWLPIFKTRRLYAENADINEISSPGNNFADIIGESEWVAELASPLDELKSHFRIEGITEVMFYVGSCGTSSSTHSENYNIPSLNYLMSGSAPKDWCFFHSKYLYDLNKLVKQEFGCTMSILHKNHVVTTEMLEAAKATYHNVRQEACDLIVTFSEGSHTVLNSGNNIALAKNWWHDSQSLSARTVKRCTCQFEHPDFKFLHDAVYGSEKGCHMTKALKRIPGEILAQEKLARQQIAEYFAYRKAHNLPILPDRSLENNVNEDQPTSLEIVMDEEMESTLQRGTNPEEFENDFEIINPAEDPLRFFFPPRKSQSNDSFLGSAAPPNNWDLDFSDVQQCFILDPEHSNSPIKEITMSENVLQSIENRLDLGKSPQIDAPIVEEKKLETFDRENENPITSQRSINIHDRKKNRFPPKRQLRELEQPRKRLKYNDGSTWDEEVLICSPNTASTSKETLVRVLVTLPSPEFNSPIRGEHGTGGAVTISDHDDVVIEAQNIVKRMPKLPQRSLNPQPIIKPQPLRRIKLQDVQQPPIKALKLKVDKKVLDEQLVKDQLSRYRKARQQQQRRAKAETKMKPVESKAVAVPKSETSRLLHNIKSNHRKALKEFTLIKEKEERNDDEDKEMSRLKKYICRLDESHILMKVIFKEFKTPMAIENLTVKEYSPKDFLKQFVSNRSKVDQRRFWNAVEYYVQDCRKNNYIFVEEIDKVLLPSWENLFEVKRHERIAIDDPAVFKAYKL